MQPYETIRWRYGALAAVSLAFLSLYPQLSFLYSRGAQWNGTYVKLHIDEVAYSAYVNALIDQRPRRNDPYMGIDDQADMPLPESLFSIQVVPSYAIALPARALGLSVSTVFIALSPIAAIASSLAIFWLLALITCDDKLSATGVLFVLCLGTPVAMEGIAPILIGAEPSFACFPFLRRYQPAVSFPLFFILCGFVWLALTNKGRRAFLSSIAAGIIFCLLVFSYFYLWTAAAAWLVCLALLWLINCPVDWRHSCKSFGIISVVAAVGFVPYGVLLSHRSQNMDSVQAFQHSHAPDLLRLPELISIILLILLFWEIWRGRINRRTPTVIFAASFSLLTIAVFNQQVIAGYVLQPHHYQLFIANYAVLIAAILTMLLVWQGRRDVNVKIPGRTLFWVAILALEVGLSNVIASPRHLVTNTLVDEAAPILRRVEELARAEESHRAITSKEHNSRAVVFATDIYVDESIPTITSQAVLWAPHMNVFPGATTAKFKERFFQYLYFMGVDKDVFEKSLAEDDTTFLFALFGVERAFPSVAINPKPLMPEEKRDALQDYSEYIASFTSERAAHPMLSYVIALTDEPFNFSNLDRWYERDGGERLGEFTLYRVKLRH